MRRAPLRQPHERASLLAGQGGLYQLWDERVGTIDSTRQQTKIILEVGNAVDQRCQ
jgi:hypothetical protein